MENTDKRIALWSYLFPDVHTLKGYRQATRDASVAAYVVGAFTLAGLVVGWLVAGVSPSFGLIVANIVVVGVAIAIGFLTRIYPRTWLHLIVAGLCLVDAMFRAHAGNAGGAIIMLLLFRAALNGVRAGLQGWPSEENV